jgi:hypothetical protein
MRSELIRAHETPAEGGKENICKNVPHVVMDTMNVATGHDVPRQLWWLEHVAKGRTGQLGFEPQ